jgi:hypothetical protein
MKLVKVIGYIFLVIIVLLFTANHFIRVASDGKSWGIVEEFIFGRPLTDVLAPPWSEEFKKWDTAAKASQTVTDLIHKYGIEGLTTSEKLTEERNLAARASAIAYSNSVAIPRTYLEASNPNLPEMYFEYFVPAMDSLQQGFHLQDVNLVRRGVTNHNNFLLWMQSQKRSDFKDMR